MKVDGQPFRIIWLNAEGKSVSVIDQTLLPHRFKTVEWRTLDDVGAGIRNMVVRGAPLIGASAGYGVALAMLVDSSDKAFEHAYETLFAARPTAANFRWALDRMLAVLLPLEPKQRAQVAFATAETIADEDVENCSAIGEHGRALIQHTWENVQRSRPVNDLPNANATWRATVEREI